MMIGLLLCWVIIREKIMKREIFVVDRENIVDEVVFISKLFYED